MKERTLFLIDCQSFYASVEKAARPELKNRPVAIGDPERPAGIILAACPLAKAYGVTTAQRINEARVKCPDLVVIRPRMRMYIRISLLITKIYESYTDQVEPFSIDEQFLDVTGSLRHYGSVEELARNIQTRVQLSTGIWTRVGVGPSKILAKTATDNFAKQRPDGIFKLNYSNIEQELWPLPVSKMYMVAGRMTDHFMRMGLPTIGDVARLELGDFKQKMRREMGKQSDLKAEYYWQVARGIDPSAIKPGIRMKPQQSISHGKTLRASLYRSLEDIEVVLLELVIEVCRRARSYGVMGQVISVSAAETDGEKSRSFGRQVTLSQPTSLTHEVAEAAGRLFRKHWSGLPVARLHISLDQLTSDETYQLTLFEDRPRAYSMERTLDGIKDRFGSDAILRASSLLEAGVARERAGQIGGHWI
ncbi:DNA polymerase IV [Paenibacillus glufosinatiresistens]|uniref:DNA polymerase IV n=1 Tax=Paenibacillus glufosinatiresistens TaxID=3070657 RepID=UPI00286DD4A1|nr:DNA polymerase IV [Paenibacillus sp. YX.27]